MKTIECCSCGIVFGVPNFWEESRRKSGRDFYCPNGHCMTFGESEADCLRKQLEMEKRRTDQARREASEAHIEAQEAGAKYKRIRDRVKNGVCPCCNRTFQNLASHMKTEHPEFGKHETLRALRLALGLTQQDVADEIGISPATVSLVERNKHVGQDTNERVSRWITNLGGK